MNQQANSKSSAVDITDLMAFHQELYAEMQNASDRAIVVIAAAGLDTLLGAIVSSATINDIPLKEVTQSDAPFSTFSNKTLACYSLGLISHGEYRELNLIRKIRNEFAHTLSASSLAGEPHVARCRELVFCEQSLTTPGGQVPLAKDPISGDVLLVGEDRQIPDGADVRRVQIGMVDSNDPRERFIHSTLALFESLQSRWLTIQTPTSPPEFSDRGARKVLSDLMDEIIARSENAIAKAEQLGIETAEVEKGVQPIRLARDLVRNADAVIDWNLRQGPLP